MSNTEKHFASLSQGSVVHGEIVGNLVGAVLGSDAVGAALGVVVGASTHTMMQTCIVKT